MRPIRVKGTAVMPLQQILSTLNKKGSVFLFIRSRLFSKLKALIISNLDTVSSVEPALRRIKIPKE